MTMALRERIVRRWWDDFDQIDKATQRDLRNCADAAIAEVLAYQEEQRRAALRARDLQEGGEG